jgi:drug/metabolite transporter (DMT)-like permease
MISAMTPFIVVPIGAAFFGERLHSRALFFAFFAVGGVAIVLFAAPPDGDASLRGCIFGVIALLCCAGYISGTRRLRGEMDVASYMAAMTPVAPSRCCRSPWPTATCCRSPLTGGSTSCC